MANWWEKRSGYYESSNNNSNNKKSKSQSQSVGKASDDIVDSLRPGDDILPYLFRAVGMGVVGLGKYCARSVSNIIERGWPSE